MSHDELLLEEELAQARLSRATAARLLAYLRPYRGWVALTLGLELLWVSSMLFGPHLVKVGIDDGILAGSWRVLWTVAGLYALNLFARMVVVVLQLRYAARTGLGVLADLRNELFEHVQTLSMSYFDRTKEGRIIARIDRDVDALEDIVVWGPLELLSCALSLVLVLVQMSFYDLRLTLAVVALTPLMIAGTEFFRRRGTAAYRKVREGTSRITGHLAEAIGGVRVLQSYVREMDDRARLREIHTEHNANVYRAATVWSAYLPFIGLIYVGAIALIVGYGGHLHAQGQVEIGEVAAFVLLLGMLFGPIEYLGSLYNLSLSAATAAERIFLLLDTPPEIVDRPDARPLPSVEGRIAFRGVDFGYAGRDRVLHAVDFDLEAGSTLALVGETGAGKSTLVNLLARFYEPTGGRIELDGHDICAATLGSLRAQLGIVPQDGFLFSGTVLDNLRVGRPDATEAEVVDAARRLGTHEALAALPDGYHTDVGERGEGLSHGQRQLVTLTRALLADPRVLILDEATSAVDTQSERVIQGAIDHLREGRTTVVVAHRLSTIFGADRILVLDQGRVVERGTHAELVEAGGRYAALYRDHVRH